MSPFHKSPLDTFVKIHLPEIAHIAHSSFTMWGGERPTADYSFTIMRMAVPENFIIIDLYGHFKVREEIIAGFPISHDSKTIHRQNISTATNAGFICDGCQGRGSMGYVHCLQCDYDLCPDCEGGFDHPHSNFLKNIGALGFNTYEKKHVLESMTIKLPLKK